MTRPDFKAEAAEIVKLVREMDGTAEYLVALKLNLIYEVGCGAGIDDTNESLVLALAKLKGPPS